MSDWSGSYSDETSGETVATAPGIAITREVWRQHRDGTDGCEWCYVVIVHGVEVLKVHEDGYELTAEMGVPVVDG